MACVSFNNISINDKCDNSNGGIRRLWISQQDNLLYKTEMVDGSDTLSNIMLFGCAEWRWKANTASYTSELSNSDKTIGVEVYTTTLNLQFTKSEQNKRKAISDVLTAGECAVVIEDMYGTKLLVEHVYMSDVTAQSGQNLSDLNGYQLTLKGEWVHLPKFINDDETVNNRFDNMVITQPKPTNSYSMEYDSDSVGQFMPEDGELFYNLNIGTIGSWAQWGGQYPYYYAIDLLGNNVFPNGKGKDIELYFIKDGEKNKQAPLSNVVIFNTDNYDISCNNCAEVGSVVFTLPFDHQGTVYNLMAKCDGVVKEIAQLENPYYQDWEDVSYMRIEIPVIYLEQYDRVFGLGFAISYNSNPWEEGIEVYGSVKLNYFD